MSLHAEAIGPVPEETARVAHAAFPKGNVYMQMREVLGTIYQDTVFGHLYAARGRPAEAPWRLALVTVMQFAEGLSDRQAAEAVRGRIDWKYALGLELTDPGFDFSVLSEFRTRLINGSAEQSLLEALLAACNARGYLKARGRQRTDSTHVLGSLRVLNRLEHVAETLRSALNAVAAVAPDWLRSQVPAEWFERYDRRVEEYRLPKGEEARRAYGVTVGSDGMKLLELLWLPEVPPVLKELPQVEILRQTWVQQFVVIEGEIRRRDPKEMPPVAQEIESPYETEARYGGKREMHWIGYKAHLTESCDDDLPHLLTHVHTTIATEADMEQLAAIHEGLIRIELLPREHFVDGGYVRGQNLLESQQEYRVDLVGPVHGDRQWQATEKTGYDVSHFQVDWEAKSATCPQGRRSVKWFETETARGAMVIVAFSPADCTPCPVRSLCTRAKTSARNLTLQPRAEHEAIQQARQRQETQQFAIRYGRRAGIEGTFSQGVRTLGLRQARYRGLGKVHLQHLATAAAVNLQRLADWLNGVPQAKTRVSHFAALAA